MWVGVQICLVLIPRKVSKLEAAVWAIFTSLPQPVMALITFYFTQQVRPCAHCSFLLTLAHLLLLLLLLLGGALIQMALLLPIGMGFAAGAMVWVAAAELYPEAAAVLGHPKSVTVATLAGALFTGVQFLMKHDE